MAAGTVDPGIAMIIGIGIVRAIGVVVRRSYAGHRAVARRPDLHERGGRSLRRQPLSWHARRPDGDLVQRAGVDAEGSVAVLAPIPFATSTVMMIFVSTIWLFSIDVVARRGGDRALPDARSSRTSSTSGRCRRTSRGRRTSSVSSRPASTRASKACSSSSRTAPRNARPIGSPASPSGCGPQRLKAIRIRSWFEGLLDVIPSLANILLVVIGAARIQSSDLTGRRVLQRHLPLHPARAAVAAHRVRVVGTAPIDRRLDAGPHGGRTSRSRRTRPTRSALASPGLGVELHGVSFVHEGEELPSVDSTSTSSVPAGSVTALVGPTGSGKSDAGDARRRPGRSDHRRGAARAGRPLGRVPGGVPARRQRRRQRPDGRPSSPTASCGRRSRWPPRPTSCASLPHAPRHRGRRTWRQPERRPAPARRTGPGARPHPEPARARRHDVGARSGDRVDRARATCATGSRRRPC